MMWNLVLTAVNEFSLALQENPADAGEVDNNVLSMSCSPFVEVLNSADMMTSPESSEDTVTAGPPSVQSQAPPVQELKDHQDYGSLNQTILKQSNISIDTERDHTFINDTLRLEPIEDKSSTQAPSLPFRASTEAQNDDSPRGEKAAESQRALSRFSSAKEEEMSWLARKLQAEVDILKVRVEQLQKDNAQLQQENIELKRKQQTCDSEGLAQKVSDLKAENQLLRISIKKMLDEKIASQTNEGN